MTAHTPNSFVHAIGIVRAIRASAARGVVVVAIATVTATTLAAQAEQKPAIAVDRSLATMTLVKSSDGSAVVRFGQSALQVVGVGDRIGSSRANVIAAVPGRLVLEEVTSGPDGKPLRAQIVIRDGETGGKKFMRHPDLNAPIALRPEIVPVTPAANGTTIPSLR